MIFCKLEYAKHFHYAKHYPYTKHYYNYFAKQSITIIIV